MEEALRLSMTGPRTSHIRLMDGYMSSKMDQNQGQ